MSVDPTAVGHTSRPWTRNWTSSDTLLYALGVGAGPEELAYVTENSEHVPQRVVPTFAAVVAGGSTRVSERLGSWPAEAKVHAGQEVHWHRPLPPEGTAHLQARISAVRDKGSGALCEVSTSAVDENGAPLFDSVSCTFIRGAGGFAPGTGSGQRSAIAFDDELPVSVPANLALVYRLSGDRNPLHSDPAFAARAGFSRPILHGLCTYGVVARTLITEVLGGDETRMRSYAARFRAPVYPSDALRIRFLRTSGRVDFVVLNGDRVVLDDGVLLADGGDAS